MSKVFWAPITAALKMHWSVSWRRYTSVLLYAAVTFVLALVVNATLVATSGQPAQTAQTAHLSQAATIFPAGTMLALLVLVFSGIITRARAFPSEFEVALSMGRTRRETLGAAGVFTLATFAAGMLAMRVLYAVEVGIYSLLGNGRPIQTPCITLKAADTFTYFSNLVTEEEALLEHRAMREEGLEAFVRVRQAYQEAHPEILTQSVDPGEQVTVVVDPGAFVNLLDFWPALLLVVFATLGALLLGALILRFPQGGTALTYCFCIAVFLCFDTVAKVLAQIDAAALETAFVAVLLAVFLAAALAVPPRLCLRHEITSA